MVAIYGISTLFSRHLNVLNVRYIHVYLQTTKAEVFFSSGKVSDSKKSGARLLLPGRLKEPTVIIDVIIHKAGSA